jgi:hypothetical protein
MEERSKCFTSFFPTSVSQAVAGNLCWYARDAFNSLLPLPIQLCLLYSGADKSNIYLPKVFLHLYQIHSSFSCEFAMVAHEFASQAIEAQRHEKYQTDFGTT